MQLSEEFINMLPQGERDALLAALTTEPEVSIRFNCKAPDTENLVLESLECRADARVQWMDQAVYLDHRPQFTMDPLLHQGCYYVQEASSMFLAHALQKCVNGPVRALDLCAAPGGKSTLLAGMLPEGSLLISNEIQRGRAQILAENMVKWGRPGVMVTCNTPKQIGESSLMFDLIAVDAPCSGEGMFRKDEGAIRDWSVRNVEMCAARQREIIEDIWPALKAGGYLIYSTCTFNRQEDEDNVRWIMDRFGAQAIDLDPDPKWNIVGSLTDDEIPDSSFVCCVSLRVLQRVLRADLSGAIHQRFLQNASHGLNLRADMSSLLRTSRCLRCHRPLRMTCGRPDRNCMRLYRVLKWR